MFVDIETDREICAVLFDRNRDANLASLGIEDIPVGVPHESIRGLRTVQDYAERETGTH